MLWGVLLRADAANIPMALAAVIETQMVRKPAVLCPWPNHLHGIGLPVQQGLLLHTSLTLGEPLGHATRPVGVGLVRIGIQGAAGLSPIATAVGSAVIREDTARDPLCVEPA